MRSSSASQIELHLINANYAKGNAKIKFCKLIKAHLKLTKICIIFAYVIHTASIFIVDDFYDTYLVYL